MIPTTVECFKLLQQYSVPVHIVQHSRVVHGVALYLCQELNLHGESLDRSSVEAGALLHDIAKMESLNKGENHSRAGALLLSRLGYGGIAEIVRQHVVLDGQTPPELITEAAVVHYADKRVRHTTIVSLAERFQDLRERYGKNPAGLSFLADLESRSFLLEKRLFRWLSIRPESLNSIFGESIGLPNGA